jgi:hypothetical protein
MIEPQRDLHNAQNPGVLVSDSIWSVFIGVFPAGIITRFQDEIRRFDSWTRAGGPGSHIRVL